MLCSKLFICKLGSQAFDLGVGSEGEGGGGGGKGRGESLRLWEMKLMIRTSYRRTRLGNPDLDFEIRISDFAIEHEIRISKSKSGFPDPTEP